MLCSKVKYASQYFADADIQRIGKKSKRSRIPIRSYLCECGSWHLTSKDDTLYEKIALLGKEVEKLKTENEELKTNNKKEANKEILGNERVIQLTKEIAVKNKTISKLRIDNATLISKLVSKK